MSQSVPINMRADLAVRSLIDRAASLVHRNRTEFVLEAARQRAACGQPASAPFVRAQGPLGVISRPENLSAEHVLDGFDCGQPSLNQWLKKRAHKANLIGRSVWWVRVVD